MENQLDNPNDKLHNLPIHTEHHGDLRHFINHFWNMIDFPQHSTANVSAPKIEVNEGKNEVTVSAEVPGIAPENLEVEISADGYLTLAGEKKTTKRTKPSRQLFFRNYIRFL